MTIQDPRLDSMRMQRLSDDGWDTRMAHRVFCVRRARRRRTALVLGGLILGIAFTGGTLAYDRYRNAELVEIWSPTGLVTMVSWGD